MSKNIKKLLILNIPYLVLGLLFTKLPEAWRHTNGVDLGQKILNLGEGLSRAFEGYGNDNPGANAHVP